MFALLIGCLFAIAGGFRHLFRLKPLGKPLGFQLVFGLYLTMKAGTPHALKNLSESEFEYFTRRYMAILMLGCFLIAAADLIR